MPSKNRFIARSGLCILGATGIFILSRCNRIENKPTNQSQERLVASAPSIQRNFVNVSCVSCHTQATAANRFVDLTNVANVIEGTGHSHNHGQMRYLVKPGCPKQSFFLSILKEGKMPPPPAEKVPTEILKVIEDWIISLKPEAASSCDGNNDEPPDGPVDGDEPGGDEPS